MLISLVEIAAGLAILYVGGHYLVQGSVVIALLARIPTAIVALTIVAMGTSMPEMAVSLDAALRGASDISYGNVIGSNIFNVGAILGIAALLAPIPVRQQTLRIEYPMMFVVSGIAVFLARDGVIDRLDGLFLIVLLVTFLAYMVYLSRRGVTQEDQQSLEREVQRTAHLEHGAVAAWGKNATLVVGGIVALALGARLAVTGAVAVAHTMGIAERVIGLTIIAMGTSLPELATSVVAARRGEPDIALGNVVGSNIFNILAILGITATVVPISVHPVSVRVDNWVMLAFSAALLPMMLRGKKVNRLNALMLLVAFASYIVYVLAGG